MSHRLLFLLLAIAFANLLGPSDAVAVEESALGASFRLTNGQSSGTCFLVDLNRRDDGEARLAAVTAAHVLEKMADQEARLILRRQDEEGVWRRLEHPVRIRDGKRPLWTRHRHLDVAVLLVGMPSEASVSPFALAQIADGEFVSHGGFRVGQACLIPCFPAQLEANRAGWPVLRTGHAASHPLAPVVRERTFLVDYSNFGGDSGAPIVIQPAGGKPEGRPMVVGLVIGQHRQTDRSTTPFEERTVHTSLGLGICIHAHFVRETIEAAAQGAQRDDAGERRNPE